MQTQLNTKYMYGEVNRPRFFVATNYNLSGRIEVQNAKRKVQNVGSATLIINVNQPDEIIPDESLIGDVNEDGKVNTLDRVILTRYIAKWEGYETLPYNA